MFLSICWVWVVPYSGGRAVSACGWGWEWKRLVIKDLDPQLCMWCPPLVTKHVTQESSKEKEVEKNYPHCSKISV